MYLTFPQKKVEVLGMEHIRYDMTLKFIQAGIHLAVVDLLGTFAN